MISKIYKILPVLIFLEVFALPVKASDDNEDYLAMSMPGQWTPQQQYYQTNPAEDSWWTTFDDPVLTRLIEKAVKNNFNVASAVKSIEMAQKSIRQAQASYYPVFTANAGWTKEKESGAAMRSENLSYYSLGASMSWEIDVFGRIYQNVKAKKAAYNVSRADYDAVLVSLCANLATAYIQLRTYQEELRVAKMHIESQRYVCKITEARYEADLGNMLDVTQAKVVLYETESSLPSIEANVQTMKNTICLLVGQYPGTLDDLLSDDGKMPDYLQNISAGVPQDLLRRRPDIVEAEMTLSEYAAEIGIAKKDFLPTLSLTGSIATTSKNLDGLFGSNSLEYSIAPQLSWTIFEGLARNYAVAEAKLQFEAAIDSYNYTVMSAVEEVENALTEYASLVKAIDLQKRVVEESHKSMQLSFELYRSGLTMFTNVVDGQISWLTNQNTLITMQGNALASLVKIYQALGGGWQTLSVEK